MAITAPTLYGRHLEIERARRRAQQHLQSLPFNPPLDQVTREPAKLSATKVISRGTSGEFNNALESHLAKGYVISNKHYTAPSNVFSALLELPKEIT